MFLEKTLKRNPQLIETAFKLHQQLEIEPDTYVIDVDQFVENAKMIINEANKHDIKLYFMLKQVGRNPYLAKKLMELGYSGAVVVDYREAEVMMKHNIPISNVGHLVQPCRKQLQSLVDYGCEYMTVYSLEKIKDIQKCAEKSNKIQKILLRITDSNDLIYSGQTAGFECDDLEELVGEIKQLKNIEIGGVTSFPCFLYDETSQNIHATHNLETILKAKQKLKELGIEIENLNTPSTTSTQTLKEMAKVNANSGEPGHGLTGTTPMHAHFDLEEIPCVVYLSEISHNFDGNAYLFGGGYYRRSHVENALVGKSIEDAKMAKVICPSSESIDYHFGLSEECNVNDTVIMAFRFQVFVTRSQVCLIEGIHSNQPKIVGIYNSLGGEVNE